MRILLNGDFSFHQELIEKMHMDIVFCGNNTYLLTLPEGAIVHKDMVTREDLPDETEEPLLSEYIRSNDSSLNDFITLGSRIVASGNFQKTDGDLSETYDYESTGPFRIFGDDNAKARTFDYSGSSQIDVEEYFHYLEFMLQNSTVVPATLNNLKR